MDKQTMMQQHNADTQAAIALLKAARRVSRHGEPNAVTTLENAIYHLKGSMLVWVADLVTK